MVENSSAPRHAECASEWRERRAPRRSCRRATRALGPAEREKRATARMTRDKRSTTPVPSIWADTSKDASGGRRARRRDAMGDSEFDYSSDEYERRGQTAGGKVRAGLPPSRPRRAPHLFFPRARAPGDGIPFKQSHPAPYSAPLCPRPRVPSSSRTNPTTRRSPSHRTVTRPWTAPAARSAPRPPRPRARSARSTPDRFAGSHTRSSHPARPDSPAPISGPARHDSSAPIPDPAHRTSPLDTRRIP